MSVIVVAANNQRESFEFPTDASHVRPSCLAETVVSKQWPAMFDTEHDVVKQLCLRRHDLPLSQQKEIVSASGLSM
jgi:hypothetical protein